MTLLIRFLFFVAVLCDTWATSLSERLKRRKGSKQCPTCFAPCVLIAEVEVEEDAPARLWECSRCGCFDNDGKNVGKRRVCKKCGHPEGPANDWTCHCRIHVPAPCCYSREASRVAGEPTGRCTYDSAFPGLDWNPRIPVTFEHR